MTYNTNINYAWERTSKFKRGGKDSFYIQSNTLNFKEMLKEFKKNLKNWHGSGNIIIYNIEKAGTKNWGTNARQEKFIKKWSKKLQEKNIKLKFKNTYEPSNLEIFNTQLKKENQLNLKNINNQ